MTLVSPVELARAKELLAASQHVYALTRGDDGDAAAADSSAGGRHASPTKKSLQVALVVPMTSRGTEMDSVAQSPLWFNLFASFVESIDWRENKHRFVFYLGFDRADSLYDTGDAWSEMRTAFKGHAKKALSWLGYGNTTVKRVVDYDPRFNFGPPASRERTRGCPPFGGVAAPQKQGGPGAHRSARPQVQRPDARHQALAL